MDKNEALGLETVLLRERVKELEKTIKQIKSVRMEDLCEEWKKTLAEERAEERERCTKIIKGFKVWAKEGWDPMILLNKIEHAIRNTEGE